MKLNSSSRLTPCRMAGDPENRLPKFLKRKTVSMPLNKKFPENLLSQHSEDCRVLREKTLGDTVIHGEILSSIRQSKREHRNVSFCLKMYDFSRKDAEYACIANILRSEEFRSFSSAPELLLKIRAPLSPCGSVDSDYKFCFHSC